VVCGFFCDPTNNGKWVTWGPFLFGFVGIFHAVETMVQNKNTKLLRISTVTVPFSQSWKTTQPCEMKPCGPKKGTCGFDVFIGVKNTPSNRQKHGRILRPSENEPQLPVSQCHINAFFCDFSRRVHPEKTTAKLVYQCLTIIFRIVKNYNVVKTMINHPPIIPQSSPISKVVYFFTIASRG
jgi:hypothetical protein